MASHGKKYQEALTKVERDKLYSAKEAIELLKEISYAGFDETVEVHIRTGLDPRQADQQIRDVVVLPNGLGKSVKVLVFAQGEAAEAAKEAGADVVADSEEVVNKIQAGWTDFDVAIATPDMMGTVGRLGRVLGPRGLMPNPKAGTVVQADGMANAIKEAKAGRVEFRLDKTANIHVPIGKISFTADQLYENLVSFMLAVRQARPAAASGNFIRRITVTGTMSPGIKVDPYDSALTL
ncbi:MAG: 50S ribosomal protein L1 [Anaerolineaceae bacterium]|jgi:large subunit ribosomal protein L1|nr:50S ribosomal protein L1 [Anaerolineaceae bacterium]